MNDADKIEHGIAMAEAEKREIDDGTARTIASKFAGSVDAWAFVSTGAVPESPSLTWRAIFGDLYPSMLTKRERLWADWLGTYLQEVGVRGPQRGWGDKWASFTVCPDCGASGRSYCACGA